MSNHKTTEFDIKTSVLHQITAETILKKHVAAGYPDASGKYRESLVFY